MLYLVKIKIQTKSNKINDTWSTLRIEVDAFKKYYAS